MTALLMALRHVDGHDYMYALSQLLDNAKEAIFIMVCIKCVNMTVTNPSCT